MLPELQKFREKYPGYDDLDDLTLATKLASKYPEYGDLLEKVKSDTQPESKNKSVSTRLWEGTGKGLIGLGKFVTGQGAMELGSALARPEGREAVGSAIAEPIKKSIEDPGGIPGRIKEYAIDNPVDIALMAIPAAKAAKLGGIAEETARKIVSPLAKTGLPERLYGSAVKAPMSKKWLDVTRAEDISMREKSISAGLKSKISPMEYGKQLTAKVTDDIGTAIDETAQRATQLGAPQISSKEILDRGLKSAYEQAANAPNPMKARAYIDSIKDEFISGHGENIPLDRANKIKQELYKEVSWPSSVAKTSYMRLKESAFKGMAHELMVDIEKAWPEIGYLNKEYGPYRALREIITRSVAREANKDIVPFSSKILFNPKFWILGLWDATVGHPYVKSHLAFTIDKARSAAGGSVKTDVKSIDEINELLRRIKEVPHYGQSTPIPKGQKLLSSGPVNEQKLLNAPNIESAAWLRYPESSIKPTEEIKVPPQYMVNPSGKWILKKDIGME